MAPQHDDPTGGFRDDDPPTRAIAASELDEAAKNDRRQVVESLIGRRLGRYAVLQRLGAGGMGEVLLGYDPELDRRVAIKLILPELGNEDRDLFRSRLLREAQALAKVSHPNVVAVYDVGTALDRIWVAMELVEGITLTEWKRQPHSWREVVTVLTAAGAGLAAAHREGIVHRDFKPGNVMVDGDGRVRVLDFGLARRVTSLSGPVSKGSSDSIPMMSVPPSAETPVDVTDERPLTMAGVMMGTPAYMAPEQFRGGEIDPRTDQFAMCVVLWELLFGQRPFIAHDRAALARRVLAGTIEEPPRGHGVPNRIRRIVRRGLSIRRDDRFADIETLRAELQRAARPLGIPRLVPVVAVAGALTTIIALRSETSVPPCEGAAARMQPTWNPERSAAIAEAFAKTGLTYATETAQRTTAVIDTYAAEWIAAHRQACEATHVGGEQSATLMDLRMACLDLRRNEVDALVTVLTEGRPSVVERSVQAVTRLEPVAPCGDPAYVLASVRPPTDPAVVSVVASQRAQLVRGKALFIAGDYARSVDTARAVFDEAQTLEYAPLVAESGIVLGSALQRAGQPDEARAVASQALQYAAAADHRYAEAQLLADLAGNLGYYAHDLAGAQRYAAHARGVLTSIGDPPSIASQLLNNEGNALLRDGQFAAAHDKYQAAATIAATVPEALSVRLTATSNLAAALGGQGRYAEAGQAARAALALNESQLGPEHPMVGTAAVNAAGAMLKAGQIDDVEPMLLRAQAIFEAAFPDGHPELAKALHNHGSLLNLRGEHEASLRKYERSLTLKIATMGQEHPSTALTVHAIGDELRTLGRIGDAKPRFSEALRVWEASVGPEHPFVAYALVGLGQVAMANAQPSAAIESFERALTIRSKAGVEGEELGEVRFWLAKALRQAGRDDVRARKLAADARSDYDGVQSGTDVIAEIDRWLRDSPTVPAAPSDVAAQVR